MRGRLNENRDDSKRASARGAKALAAAAIAGSFAVAGTGRAADLTWTGNGSSNSWNTTQTNLNWNIAGTPTAWSSNGSNDTAHFAATTSVFADTVSTAAVRVKTISFDASAANYTITGGPFTLSSGGSMVLSSNAGTNVFETVTAGINIGTAGGASSVAFTNNDTDAGSSFLLAGPIAATNTGNNTTVSFNGTGAGTSVVSGAISDLAGGTRTTAVVVSQTTGAWKFTGANTYTGTTVIASLSPASPTAPGTLILDGSINANVLGATNVTVGLGNGSGVLKVQNNVNIGTSAAGTLTLTGGDGSSTGQGTLDLRDNQANTLTLKNATATTAIIIGGVAGKNAILDFDLAGSSSDQIVTTQDLATGAGGGVINLSLVGTVANTTFTLITTGGQTNGTDFSRLGFDVTFAQVETIGNQSFTLGVSGNNLQVTVAAVPEPTAMGLIVLATGGLLRRRDRAAR